MGHSSPYYIKLSGSFHHTTKLVITPLYSPPPPILMVRRPVGASTLYHWVIFLLIIPSCRGVSPTHHNLLTHQWFLSWALVYSTTNAPTRRFDDFLCLFTWTMDQPCVQTKNMWHCLVSSNWFLIRLWLKPNIMYCINYKINKAPRKMSHTHQPCKDAFYKMVTFHVNILK